MAGIMPGVLNPREEYWIEKEDWLYSASQSLFYLSILTLTKFYIRSNLRVIFTVPVTSP